MDARLKHFIGARVRVRRKARRETQEQLAMRIGRTVESVSNIERAQTLPTLETLIAMSVALDLPLREFFPPEDGARVLTPRRQRLESEMWETIRALTEERLDIAVPQVAALK